MPRSSKLAAALLCLAASVALGPRAAASRGRASACPICHGEGGIGQAGIDAPRLAGQTQDYLLRRLRAFAGGSRAATGMAGGKMP